MKFYCLTPCLNAKKFIGETMLSVLNQKVFENENCVLNYTICDGKSTDGTIDVIEQLITDFALKKNIKVNYISKPDNTMYDALVTGFKSEQGSSDVYCYINAGDYYSPYAFEIVADIFSNNKQVHFLTGMNTAYNEKGHITNCYKPFFYNQNLLLKGFYGKVLPFVQQESTFWDSSVHKLIDYDKLKTFKVAGDYFLWQTFIRQTPLYIAKAWLSGFRIHYNQLSKKDYQIMATEMKNTALKPNVLDYLLAYGYKIADYLPEIIKQKLAKKVFIYNHYIKQYQLSNN